MNGDPFDEDEYSDYIRLPDIIYKIFSSKYGLKKLTDQHIVDLVYSCCYYRGSNEEVNFFCKLLEESITPRDLCRVLHIRKLSHLLSDGYIFANTEGQYNVEYISFERVTQTIRALYGLNKTESIIGHPIESMLRRILDMTMYI